MRKTLLLGCLVTLAVSSQAQIINEGFEGIDTLPENSYKAYTGGQAYGNWKVVGTPSVTGIDLVRDVWPGSALGSDYWTDLAGTPGPGGITRDLNLKKGTYTLAFLAFTNNGAYQIDFGIQGVESRTISNSLVGADNLPVNANWTLFTEEYEILSDGTYALSFVTPQGGNGNVGIDDILFDTAGGPGGQQAVPEPFTLALGAAGLVSALRRRRHRN